MIYGIPSSRHLIDKLDLPKGSCTFKQFTDGEWHVTVHDEVRNKTVWVLAQTGPPADTIIQLLLLCDALKREGAQLNLLITYFGYARQDRYFKGEPVAAELLYRLLQLATPNRIDVIHLHNPDIGTLNNHIPYEFFYDCVEDADIIVSPDKGAQPLAQQIAQHTNRELVMLEKHRPAPEQVELTFIGDVQDKKVLIVDDMITTGRTILTAAELLYEKGAHSVNVAATHGVFTADARTRLENSSIERVSVTNTLKTQPSGKVRVIEIAPYLQRIIGHSK